MAEFIRRLPKAELHIHLEGSIQPDTLLELARRHDCLHTLPAQNEVDLRRWFRFTGFPHFMTIYWTISDLLRTPEDFALAVDCCAQDMARQNIVYREITFTPFTHTHLQEKGLSIDNLLEGLETGRQEARRQYQVEIAWIFDIPRNSSFHSSQSYDPYPAQRTLDYALAGRDRGVVGLGLGGNEVGAPPEPFAHAFRIARSEGLASIPHAGETMGAQSVWGALDMLHADRIGHGVRAIEDPRLLSVLHDRQIPLEVSLTSNICLHVYRRLAEHPLPHLDRMGLLLTVNSDDPPLFNTTLSEEYARLAIEFGYSTSELARLARNAFAVSAAPPELKHRLLTAFDAWTAANLPTQSQLPMS
jgi:adenosine deaminase